MSQEYTSKIALGFLLLLFFILGLFFVCILKFVANEFMNNFIVKLTLDKLLLLLLLLFYSSKGNEICEEVYLNIFIFNIINNFIFKIIKY